MYDTPPRYAGFWVRTGATIVDCLLIILVLYPILLMIYGWEYFASEQLVQGPADLLLNWFLPIFVTIYLWNRFQATPGKLLFNLKIVDAETLQPATLNRLIIRYFGYFVSILPFFLGFFWVGWDSKKQSWHDKMGKTVVIHTEG